MHHPLISFARHHTDWTDSSYGRSLRQKRQQLLSMLQKWGVQLLLSSHDHLYEHSIVRASSHSGPDIHVIITGGGGVPLRPVSDAAKIEEYRRNYVVEGLDVALVKQEAIYHYCLVDIASDKITIRVMEVTGDSKNPLRLAEEITVKDGDAP